MLGASALGRPRGMVWGGRREEGGGFRMGNTCIPVADSFWYLAKLIQSVKFKNKIKFFLKIKKKKKLNIQKMKIMASGPITSWEIDGETVETVSDFIFLGSKITTDGDCSHEIKRHQSRFDARYWRLGASALRRPRGMVWGGRKEEGSGWGIHVYLWRIHFDIWQN